MRVFVILLGFGLVGCASSPKVTNSVNYADGINGQEASLIAADYLHQHLSASLGHTGPFDGGTAWVFKITGDVVPMELAGVPPVLVNKATGAVTWEANAPLKK